MMFGCVTCGKRRPAPACISQACLLLSPPPSPSPSLSFSVLEARKALGNRMVCQNGLKGQTMKCQELQSISDERHSSDFKTVFLIDLL